MAKGTPLDLTSPVTPTKQAAPEIFKPVTGEALTKAKTENKGYFGAPPAGSASNIVSQWTAPTAGVVPPVANRNTLADLIVSRNANGSAANELNYPNLHGRGGASHGDRGGYSTSGSGWGGNSSAGAGYGMGGRDRG